MLNIKPKSLPVKKLKIEKRNNLKSQQLRQEFLSAIKRYQDATGNGRVRRKRLIYSRPWFLVCGPKGSGKSTLLNKTGLNWIASYPEEPEEQLQWRFADEAVWIDLPGSLLEDTANAEFQEILETLAWIRGRRPLDGILLVIDCEGLLDAELVRVKYRAEMLRRRIDQIIKLWGIELPVYPVFSKADKITGFNTIFSDPSGKWNERVIGATLDAVLTGRAPKELFLEEFTFVLDWIKEIQVKMLARDRDPANRRLICQFPIMFESLRDKLSSLITSMFKNSDYTGRPLFGGFFFTSCQIGDLGFHDGDDRIFDVSKTIISHPLNPKKKTTFISHDSLGVNAMAATYFVNPIFTNVIPKHAAPISTTEQKLRQNTISLLWKSAAAIMVIILFSFFEWKMSSIVRRIDKKVRTDFSIPVTRSTDGIKQLYGLMQHYLDFQSYARHRTFSMFITRYDAKGVYSEVKDAFISSVFNYIMIPCSDELKKMQVRMVNLSENSPENDFLKLKQMLQTYLAISDSNQNYSGVIDKKIITPVLHKMALTSIYGSPNITSGLDTMLASIINEYVSELQKTNDTKYRIQTNINLVRSVQKKLVAMFDVNAVYAMACSDLLTKSKQLGLVDIIGNDIPVNLNSLMTLNEVYTPVGWDGNVRKKFREASYLRENIEDWAIGGNRGAYSGIFNDQQLLYKGLVQRYSEDVKTQWLNFINSISMDKFGSLLVAQQRLLQVSGAQSDIAKLINKFADWSSSFIKTDSGIVNEPSFLKFTDEMAFLRQFAVSNLPQYQKQFEEVAKGLVKSSEENSILGIFTGRDGDPLLGTYQFISTSVLLPLSKDQKGFLEHLLMEPYNRTIEILKPELARDLDVKWKDVFELFDGSFKRLYPFSDNDKEASFNAVIEFFNPVSGKFWKTYNDYFSPYITKNLSSNFESRNLPGMIPVRFSSSFLKSLSKADTISHIFYKDGKNKLWKVTILPQYQQATSAKKLKKAVITLGKESIAMLTEPGKFLKWPVDGDVQNVALDFTDNLDRSGKKLIHGQWSFMRLMNSSYTQSGNNFQSSFTVELKTWHNSIIQVTLPASVTVSSSEPGHPFCNNVLKGFAVPGTPF
ncbi:MAG TPA: type VI secretion protein IcmF/TssM N-terminal domain-containing protein [Chitinispirillaceae bacterium]|nr:type VI secretion protein IcmF/TssM N-terminal domain-containing protein [Chitinispirillaceae bacterium]